MKNAIFLLLLVPHCLQAQTGIAIMKASASKIRAMKSITYNIYYENNAQEKQSADITIKRTNDLPIFETGLIKATGIALDNNGSKQFAFAYNGTSFDFI